jgi:hypothetical protein
MDKETLRMQMLSGVITESEYKAKLEEDIYDLTSFHKGPHSTGRPDFNKMTADEIEDYLEKDKDNPGGLFGRSLSIVKHILDKKRKEDTQKDSLNEHYVAGGIVGIGAINQIPSRTKAVYEDAFEHFLGQKYGINEMEGDVEEGKEEVNEENPPLTPEQQRELEKAYDQLAAVMGIDPREAAMYIDLDQITKDKASGKLNNEGKYKEQTENIYEISLKPEEKSVLDDLVNTLNEGEGWIDKLKNYAKKGMITLGIISALLGGTALTVGQKQEVVDTVKTEMPAQNKELGYVTDAWTANSILNQHKDKVTKLAQDDVEVYGLVNDLTSQDFYKMSPDQHVLIGKNNQNAIKKIMDIQNYKFDASK